MRWYGLILAIGCACGLAAAAVEAAVPVPAERTWSIDVRNVHGHFIGKIVITRAGAGWNGKISFDQERSWEELRNIRITPQDLGFDRPAAAQTFTGRFLPGRKVAGTFTWAGKNWDWTGEETTVAPPPGPGADAKVQNMGPQWNSTANDLFPQLGADGRAFYFTSARSGGLGKDDLYAAERGPEGWGAPAPLPAPPNSPRAEGAASFSADGQQVVFVGCGWEGGLGSCDLYQATLSGMQWSEPANLGPTVNSPHLESQPALSADGQTLVFSSNRPGGHGGNDLWVTRRDAAGNWLPPLNLGPGLNTPAGEGGPALAPDGRTLYFASDRPGGYGNLDLYRSSFSEAGPPVERTWSIDVRNVHGHFTGKIVVTRAGAGWNGKIWFDQYGTWEELRNIRISPQQLLFDRPGAGQTFTGNFLPDRKVAGTFTWAGQNWDWAGEETTAAAAAGGAAAGVDLYAWASAQDAPLAERNWRIAYANQHGSFTGKIVIARAGEGWTGKIWFDQYARWEELRNIRISPQQLVFDRPGAGQTYTGSFLPGRKVAGTFTWAGKNWDWAAEETTAAATGGAAGGWTEPVNLGQPINSEHRENSFAIGGAGDTGYFASDRPGGLGGLDLYTATLPPALRPEPTVIVRGVVTEAKQAAPIEAEIALEDIATGAPLARLRSNAATGRYLVVLPAGRTYGLSVGRSGYFFHSSRIEVPGNTSFRELTQDVRLVPLTKGARGMLNNVFFRTGKTDLSPESRQEIERAAILLRASPTVVVEIAGHTDNVGNFDSNMVLSAGRAAVVRDALVAAGVAASQLKAAGYGPSRPLAGNDTEAGRQANRRTEMIVLSE